MFDGAGIKGRGRPGRVIGRVLAVVTAVAAFTVAAPGVQQADAAAPCPGRLAKTVTFSTGELRVYERGDYACAVTLAKRPGVRRSMSVSLQPRGGRADTDSGRFTRQAGPVTVHPSTAVYAPPVRSPGPRVPPGGFCADAPVGLNLVWRGLC